jgi:CTP:molybdopterin cytidylyltransferase MocA
MGSPKALVRYLGLSAVERISATLATVRVKQQILVSSSGEVYRHFESLGLVEVYNPQPKRGRTGSLQLGLGRARDASGVLLWPVDCPLVTSTTLSALLSVAPNHPLARPRCHGMPGHPLWIRADLFDEVLAMAPDRPLRDLIHRDPARVAEVETGDPAVVDNINTPEDVERVSARERSRNG